VKWGEGRKREKKKKSAAGATMIPYLVVKLEKETEKSLKKSNLNN